MRFLVGTQQNQDISRDSLLAIANERGARRPCVLAHWQLEQQEPPDRDPGEAAGALPHPENPRVSRREGRDETAEIRLRRGPRGRPPRHHHWSGVPSPVACGRGRLAVDCLVRVAAGPTRPGHTGEIATPRP